MKTVIVCRHLLAEQIHDQHVARLPKESNIEREADMELTGYHPRRRAGRVAAVVAGTLLLMGASSAAKPCCFTNPKYSGVCAVEPAKGETCQSILDYLNNPQSQGKTYCGNTNVRGGWKRATCQK